MCLIPLLYFQLLSFVLDTKVDVAEKDEIKEEMPKTDENMDKPLEDNISNDATKTCSDDDVEKDELLETFDKGWQPSLKTYLYEGDYNGFLIAR